MFSTRILHRALPIFLIWVAAPLPLWIMAVLMLFI